MMQSYSYFAHILSPLQL